jgi:hypothetical protein
VAAHSACAAQGSRRGTTLKEILRWSPRSTPVSQDGRFVEARAACAARCTRVGAVCVRQAWKLVHAARKRVFFAILMLGAPAQARRADVGWALVGFEHSLHCHRIDSKRIALTRARAAVNCGSAAVRQRLVCAAKRLHLNVGQARRTSAHSTVQLASFTHIRRASSRRSQCSALRRCSPSS